MNDMESFPKNRMKVTILGDSRVGKTCLMLRYMYDSFDIDPRILYIEFRNKTVDVSGVKVMLQILDTDSNENFRPLIRISLRNFVGIIIVFDLTSKSSFDTSQYWLQQVHEHARENVDIILVGNKVDLAESRAIDHETASSLAQTFGAMYVECSAKTGANVDLVFNSLASNWAKHVPVEQEEPLLSGPSRRYCAENIGPYQHLKARTGSTMSSLQKPGNTPRSLAIVSWNSRHGS